MTLKELRDQLTDTFSEDPYRAEMRVVNSYGEDITGIDIQRDKHGLAVLVLNDERD